MTNRKQAKRRIIRGGTGMIFVASVIIAGLAIGGYAAPAASESNVDRTLPAHWVSFRHIPAVVDLAGPSRNGQLTLALGGRLSLFGPSGLVEFARGRYGYSTARGTEPYIARAPGSVAGVGKRSFTRDDVYALEPSRAPAVIRIDSRGDATRFASLPRGSFPNGIAFDTTGAFGRRLLVSAAADGLTSIFSIDGQGAVQTVTRRAPRVEGGIAVAPPSFGSFAGELIAPDEVSGTIYAVDTRGNARIVAKSGLAHGGDIGVESEGFVPSGFSGQTAAYLADRSVPGNAHPGTNSILKLPGADLTRAGVKPGDLIVASEGGAETIAVRCQRTCIVKHIAAGPPATHAEGHIVFANAL
ncbi:MAG TPA: hypothetical protein VG032_03570 [Acidimicrobiales bacterium]|jgi:hypothetical protein|nr:hypothetical protein [Acidimicrobiales bacterium]